MKSETIMKHENNKDNNVCTCRIMMSINTSNVITIIIIALIVRL